MAERCLHLSYRGLSLFLGAACTLGHMKRRTLGAGAVVVAAACALAGVASAASPVSGSISGPVTSVKGSTFTVTTSLSPTGKSTVTVSKSTTITAQETVALSSLKTGVCVMATGQKNSKGVVAAQRISVTTPVKGKCTAGFGGRGGGTGTGTRPPGSGTGGQRPPGAGNGNGGFGNLANFGSAFGEISAVKGDTLTVKGVLGTKATTTTVTVSSKTQLSKTAQVGASGIAVKDCAFVRGTSSDKGVTVTAQNVALTKPTSAGCQFGFRGR